MRVVIKSHSVLTVYALLTHPGLMVWFGLTHPGLMVRVVQYMLCCTYFSCSASLRNLSSSARRSFAISSLFSKLSV